LRASSARASTPRSVGSRWLQEEGEVRESRLAVCGRRPSPSPPPQVLTEDQLRALIKAAAKDSTF
ncbi:MAG TPA: hypothetical protein VE737_08480, partial [Actinomycetota bacterium]|nr:hypothetical protein [Actinomycetota bacterium]